MQNRERPSGGVPLRSARDFKAEMAVKCQCMTILFIHIHFQDSKMLNGMTQQTLSRTMTELIRMNKKYFQFLPGNPHERRRLPLSTAKAEQFHSGKCGGRDFRTDFCNVPFRQKMMTCTDRRLPEIQQKRKFLRLRHI